MTALWVIPCKYDPERPVIFDCVASIRAHHPDVHIAVIDSDSDTLYLPDAHTDVYRSHNRNYAPGAFKWAVEAFADIDFFYMLFDSLIVNANLDWCQQNDLTTVRWIDSARHGWGWNDDTGEPLDNWATARGVTIPPRFPGVFGPMLMAHRSVIEKANLFRLLPTNRFEQCALERCWGIWLADAGYDVTEHSLQGEHVGHFDIYDETYVTKRELHRA